MKCINSTKAMTTNLYFKEDNKKNEINKRNGKEP